MHWVFAPSSERGLRIKRFQLVPTSAAETDRLLRTLDRECRQFGAGISVGPDGRFALSWAEARAGALTGG